MFSMNNQHIRSPRLLLIHEQIAPTHDVCCCFYSSFDSNHSKESFPILLCALFKVFIHHIMWRKPINKYFNSCFDGIWTFDILEDEIFMLIYILHYVVIALTRFGINFKSTPSMTKYIIAEVGLCNTLTIFWQMMYEFSYFWLYFYIGVQ